MSAASKYVAQFLEENRENLGQLERDLVELERQPAQTEILARIFRAVHTLKGGCGFLGYQKLEALTHAGESVLAAARDGRLRIREECIGRLLALVDAIGLELDHIGKTGSESGQDHAGLVSAFERLLLDTSSTSPAPALVPAPAAPAEGSASTGRASPAGEPCPPAAPVPEGPKAAGIPGPRTPGAESAAAQAGESEPAEPASQAQRLRVSVELLDSLMNLVGELVLTRNQILDLTGPRQDAALLSAVQRLGLVTAALQNSVTRTRLQPVRVLLDRFPRLIRDISAALGKRVRLRVEGEETELDKSLLEAFADPLMHALRNALDHGLERPEVRKALGKPEEGEIRIRAFHENGQVNLEISDDGGGVALEKVRDRAVQRGLVTSARAAEMGPRELLHLVFLPGFSTAEEVTTVSGRGVGLDVVRIQVEKAGGAVELQSTPGQGSTLKVRIPLTLAIVLALLVRSGRNRYAVPHASLRELVRLDDASGRNRIEYLHGAPVFRLRGRLLPLVFLDRELGQSGAAGGAGCSAGSANLLVLETAGRLFGLVVDRVDDTGEIVVKPLGRHVKGIPIYAGATVLGDGTVALILDVLGLARRAQALESSRGPGTSPSPEQQAPSEVLAEKLVLLRARDDGRMALPIAAVERFESVPEASVERTGPLEVLQHHGRILPLIRVSETLPDRRQKPRQPLDARLPGSGNLHVVICNLEGCQVGLAVDRILDVVEEPLKVRRPASRWGVSGCAVIHDRVTELLDLQVLVKAASALHAGRPGAAGGPRSKGPAHGA